MTNVLLIDKVILFLRTR